MNLEKNLKAHEVVHPERREILAEEAGTMRKLGKKAKKIAKVLTFFTLASLGCALPKQKEDGFEPGKARPAAEEIEAAASTRPFGEEIDKARERTMSDEERSVLKIAEEAPWEFLGRIDEFASLDIDLVPYIEKAGLKAPESLFNAAPNLVLLKIPGLDLAALITKAALKDPGGFYINLGYLRDIPDLDLSKITKEEAAASVKNPWVFLNTVQYIPKDIPDVDLTSEAISVCDGIPYRFIGSANKLKNVTRPSEWQEQLEKSFETYPEAIKSYGETLKSIKDPKLESTRVLQTINDWTAALLLNDMVRHGLSEEGAVKIANNENELFKALVKIKSEPGHIGGLTVEEHLRDLSLKTVKQINDLHEESNTVRFKPANGLKSRELYGLMAYGEEEIFTSTFNGLFDRMMVKMRNEKINGQELLRMVDNNKFRTFIKECAGYNRLNEFLGTMDKENAHALLSDVVKNLDAAKDGLSQATTVADIFGVITDKEALAVLQEQVKQEYERVNGQSPADANGKIIYGILAGMSGDRALAHKDWFNKMSAEFPLGNFKEIKSADLFNDDDLNVQQYLFYNDKDGKDSFRSFMSQYQNDRKWQIEKKDHYAVIRSAGNGKRIEIYASYPEFEGEAPEEIAEALKEKNLQTNIMAHRGHSYHARKTIERISPTTKIVSLGSCGGYNNVFLVLEGSPGAHIISTKGTGTMYVNDPLFKMLNEEILSGKDISWPEFWASAEKKLGKNPNFRDYVAPHKNLGVMFLKTYNKELERAKDLLVAEK